MNIWNAIKSFLSNLGHTFLSEIMAALPEAKQILLASITALVDAAIAYIENKYAPHMAEAKEGGVIMTPEEKMKFDSTRREEALAYVKAEMAKIPEQYANITDSLVYLHIEVSVQKAKTLAAGNHGNFPGGKDSNDV